MDYHGHIQSGVVVLEDAPSLPDGTPVTLRVESPVEQNLAGRELEKLAGLADLPTDIAEKHDAYRRGRVSG